MHSRGFAERSWHERAVRVSSAKDPLLLEDVALLERSERYRRQQCLVEGSREVARALRSAWPVERFYLAEETLTPAASALVESNPHIPVVLCSTRAYAKISVRQHPADLIAVVTHCDAPLATLAQIECPLYVVAEQLEKPGNLGALLRTVDGAGAHALLCTDPRADLLNPNVVRASTGSLFFVPCTTAEPSTLHDWLKTRHCQIVIATPEATLAPWEINWAVPTALVVGSEQEGVTTFWKERADHQIALPMLGYADSLNVTAATTAILYEAVRQRSTAAV